MIEFVIAKDVDKKLNHISELSTLMNVEGYRNALDKSDKKKFGDNGTGNIFESLPVRINEEEK
jgi:hypothetical protein